MIESIYTARYWAEIDLDHLAFNYQQAKNKVPTSTKLMCVLKADAYGQGAVGVAKALSEAGADYFAVALPEEALQLRRSGITTPILLLGMIRAEWVQLMRDNDITITIGDMEAAREYVQVIGEGSPLKVHVCLDTGMNRIGLKPDLAVEEIQELFNSPVFDVEGIWTHFPAAGDPNEEGFTLSQITLFNSVVDQLAARGIEFSLRHYANSDAIASFTPEMYCGSNMARPGLILYGTVDYSSYGVEMRPVMSLRAPYPTKPLYWSVAKRHLR